MMGVIIPMDRIRDRAERPENNPVPYPDTSGRSRYAVIVGLVLYSGLEEMAAYLEAELGDGVPTDFLQWLSEEVEA